MPQIKIYALVDSQTDAFAVCTDIDWLVKIFHDRSFDFEFAPYFNEKYSNASSDVALYPCPWGTGAADFSESGLA